MSNLDNARLAIEAEIQHSKEGLAYYETQIESLEAMLAQLLQMGGAPSDKLDNLLPVPSESKSNAKPAKTGRKAKSKKVVDGDKLPFTGGDFWINLITDTPKPASTVLKDAIHKLKIEPTPDQVKKLQGRMVFALNALVNSGKIQDSGSGRQRVFLKA